MVSGMPLSNSPVMKCHRVTLYVQCSGLPDSYTKSIRYFFNPAMNGLKDVCSFSFLRQTVEH